MKSSLIVLEGLDGAGKSTQLELLAEQLAGERPVRKLKFPDYQDPSSALVQMYLNGEFGANPEDTSAYAASILYAADRFASFRRHWKQAYEDGGLFLSDRYTQANVIYQMPKLPRSEWKQYIDWLYDLEYNKMAIPRPDLVVLLDLDSTLAERQVMARYHGDASLRDIHERDYHFLHVCREAALTAAEYLGWKVVSCNGEKGLLSREEINRALLDAALPVLE